VGVLFRVATLHAASAWYVSPSGNDAADCQSPATACLTISAAVAKAAPNDTVLVAAGTYPETLTLAQPVTVVGSGTALTVVDSRATRRTVLVSGTTVSLSGMTLANGYVANDVGGGIYLNGGSLALTDVVITGSVAQYGGGLWLNGNATLVRVAVLNNVALSGVAGGIDNEGQLSIDQSTISGNQALQGASGSPIPSGGGIFSEGTLTLTNSTLSQNHSDFLGGGIRNLQKMFLANVTIRDNGAVQGGGLHNNGCLSLVNVTFSGNHADGDAGGAIYWDNSGSFCDPTLFAAPTNLTIAGNRATTGGGGIYAQTAVALKNTILSANTAANCGGFVQSQGHNLDSGTSCNFHLGGDVSSTDPLLGPLQDNGGDTWTEALVSGSPAIDSGDNTGCPTTDQRGAPRPVDGDGNGSAICDMGAYEAPAFSATPTPTATLTNTPTPTLTPTRTTTPTITQTPTRTPKPTQVHKPTNTPKPTRTLAP
jgi:predicted outer membrane repeat protein